MRNQTSKGRAEPQPPALLHVLVSPPFGHLLPLDDQDDQSAWAVPLEVLRDTIQSFPTFSEIYVAALKALRLTSIAG